MATIKDTAVREEMLAAAIDKAKSGDTQGFSVFNPGDPDASSGVPIENTPLDTNRDRITIYDTSTGEPRNVAVVMLRKIMGKVRGNKPAFALTPDGLPEFYEGSVVCFLSPNHPDRDEYRKMGVHVDCSTQTNVITGYTADRKPIHMTVSADHLASEMDRELHMQHKHPRAWAIIQQAIARKEREEEMAMRKSEMEAIRELASSRGTKNG